MIIAMLIGLLIGIICKTFSISVFCFLFPWLGILLLWSTKELINALRLSKEIGDDDS